MDYLLPTFIMVSVVFAIAALFTGAQAIVDPVGFSRSFGLPLSTTRIDFTEPAIDQDGASSKAAAISHYDRSLTMSYVSLMGVRQLATGIILLTFALRSKWTEMATVLLIIGIIVAGTDGIYLSRAGAKGLGQLHAIPGALIAALAAGVLFLHG